MAQLKRRLTHSEEFEIMKLVLDKFLWLGIAFAGWGLYQTLTTTFQQGIWNIIIGVVIMLLFAWIITRKFEMLR